LRRKSIKKGPGGIKRGLAGKEKAAERKELQRIKKKKGGPKKGEIERGRNHWEGGRILQENYSATNKGKLRVVGGRSGGSAVGRRIKG